MLPPMAAVHHHLLLLLSFLSLFILALPSPEADALLQLKKSFTDASSLSSWTEGTEPCAGPAPWRGILCFHGIVTGLRLGSLGLAGSIDMDALSKLHGVRTVSFTNNSLSGTMPQWGRAGKLKSIFLSQNQFSGVIPGETFDGMTSLKKLWLSQNKFSGEIPSNLTTLSHLLELHLEDNEFSGNIPEFNKSTVTSLNVSNNHLTGPIPVGMIARYGRESFLGNPELCFTETCSQDNIAAPKQNSGRLTASVVVAAALVGLCLVLWAVASWRQWGSSGNGEVVLGGPNVNGSLRKKGAIDEKAAAGAMSMGAAAELLFVQEGRGGFGLMDLMKAAAEVLGSGGLGSAYKAVMASGVTVVVKRMREMNGEGKDGFDVVMRRLGRARHRNVLPPVAYHYRKEEKLLVYDYAANGNLLFLLHGDRGPNRLDWVTRMRIIRGIINGLAYLHLELANFDLPHGNLKSSNVLFREDNEPLLSDYGFSSLVSPALASYGMVAYKTPEYIQYERLSQKSDIWCLGLIILEILTAKFPSQYLNNGKGGTDLPTWVRSTLSEGREADVFDPEILHESRSVHGEMRQILQLAIACTESSPDRRPDIAAVKRRIEEIKGEEYLRDRNGQGGDHTSQHGHTSAVSSRRSGGGGSYDDLSSYAMS